MSTEVKASPRRTVTIDGELYAKVEEMAEVEHRSCANLVELLILQEVERRASAAESDAPR